MTIYTVIRIEQDECHDTYEHIESFYTYDEAYGYYSMLKENIIYSYVEHYNDRDYFGEAFLTAVNQFYEKSQFTELGEYIENEDDDFYFSDGKDYFFIQLYEFGSDALRIKEHKIMHFNIN